MLLYVNGTSNACNLLVYLFRGQKLDLTKEK